MTIEALADHLWQSTLFATLIAIATVAFRNNRAAVRHALWLTASIKFLIPFAALVAIGEHTGLRSPLRLAPPTVSVVVDTVSQPFVQLATATQRPAASAHTGGHALGRVGGAGFALASLIWIAGSLAVLSAWIGRYRRLNAVARHAAPLAEGDTVDALRRIERLAGVTRPIPLVVSKARLEPGVFGIVRPVLVWPQTASQLHERQIDPILMHEVTHVRRHDNLLAALHMVVEALFWFHPIVWWIGARLIEERERACDEAVIGSGQPAEVYAEAILEACRLYIESPLPCVAGVTGSDLEQRIERIMREPSTAHLTLWKKAFLGSLATLPIATPIALGAIASTSRPDVLRTKPAFSLSAEAAGQAQPEFEVASVKPNKSGDNRIMFAVQPGGRFSATNVSLRMLIRNAYQLQDFQIVGGPDWVSSDHFDVVAKAERDDLGDPFRAEKSGEPSRGQLMLRTLLADRFKLEAHMENREMSIFALVLARSDGRLGPQLQKSSVDCEALIAGGRGRGPMPPPGPAGPGDRVPCGIRVAPGNMAVGGATLTQFANSLGMFVARIVVDRTGLEGSYEFNLTWTPDQMAIRPPGAPEPPNAPPVDPNGPSIFTALQEQLGLKLDSQKGPVSVLVIDRVARPSEN